MPIPLLYKRSAKPTTLRYLTALALFGFAFALRFVLLPVESRLPYATFTPSVLLALYFLGLGPGLVVAALGSIAGLYFFTPPYYSLEIDSGGWLSLLGFLSSSLLAAWIVSRLHRALRSERRSTNELSLSEQRLRHIVDDQTEMLFRFDAAGHFTFANDAGRRVFRLSDEDLRKNTWHCLVNEGDMTAVKTALAAMTAAQPVVRTQSRFPGPAGESLWGEFVHHGLFDTEGALLEVQTVGRDITWRVRLQEQLAVTNARMQDLYDNAPCGYYSLDQQGRFVQVNRTTREWLGCTDQDLLGKLTPRDFMDAEGVAQFDANFPLFLAEGRIGPLEFNVFSRGGVTHRVSLTATAIRDEHGRFLRSRSVMYDVSELAAMRRKLEALTAEQEAVLESDLIGIVKLKDRRPTWQNRGLALMFGYGPNELIGQPARILYPSDEAYEALGKAAYPVLMAGQRYRTQLQLKRKDGTLIWIDMSGVMLSKDSDESVWMMLDITAMKAYEAEVEDAAFHDGLTGLPNRMLLMQRLDQALAQAAIQGHLVAVCFVDLDGFKAINDRYGHSAGDLVLKATGQRLESCLRGSDTVARLGGDEFVLLLTSLGGKSELDAVLQRVVTRVAEPIRLSQDLSGQVSASVGVAFSEPPNLSSDQLLDAADTAMYAAKRAEKNRVVVG